MKRKIAVVTTSRADYSHLYWPLHDLRAHPDVDLRLIVLGSHLSPEFGMTVREIEKDGFEIAGRIECLLSSDTDVGMAKTIGLGDPEPRGSAGRNAPRPFAADRGPLRDARSRGRGSCSQDPHRSH